MGRSDQGVSGREVVWVPQKVWGKQSKACEAHQKCHEAQEVLVRKVGMEGDLVCVRINAGWVVRPRLVQENKVNYGHGGHNEGEKEVECEESAKGGVVNGKAAPDSLDQSLTNVWHGREEVRNDSRAPEGHLSSRQDVAHERSHHYQEEKDYPDISCLFVQVGAVVQASSDVKVNTDKEERGAIGVHVTD